MITILQMRKLRLREMKGLSPHPPTVSQKYFLSPPSFHVHQQSKRPTFTSPHTDHHPPPFPLRFLTSSNYREEWPLSAQAWGPCSYKGRHGLLTPESRI